MAYFVEMINDRCGRIIVVNDEMIGNPTGLEGEEQGIAFCKSLYGENTVWMQVSLNGEFRNRYPAPGMVYDKNLNVFLYSKPNDEAILNTTTFEWEKPE